MQNGLSMPQLHNYPPKLGIYQKSSEGTYDDSLRAAKIHSSTGTICQQDKY